MPRWVSWERLGFARNYYDQLWAWAGVATCFSLRFGTIFMSHAHHQDRTVSRSVLRYALLYADLVVCRESAGGARCANDSRCHCGFQRRWRPKLREHELS